jgi:arylsulfatase A-like enzyme
VVKDLKKIFGFAKRDIQEHTIPWRNLFLVAFFSGLAYVFMEWLFIVTKPSFMDSLAFIQKLWILLFAIALINSGILLLLSVIVIVCKLPWFRNYRQTCIKLSVIVPAGILASLAMLMVDNFTYTLIRFGIVSTQGWQRGVYAGLYLLAIFFFYQKILQYLQSQSSAPSQVYFRPKVSQRLGFIIAVLSLLTVMLGFAAGSQDNWLANDQAASTRPNILIITADGVNATHMSAYGYERQTTPRISQLAETSLLAENAFTVSGNTSGSLISFYTGKYPTTVRLIYPPDILRGADAYQHLPGLLRLQGYRTIQVSVDHYADAQTLNVLNGFDVVNQEASNSSTLQNILRSYLPDDYAFFTYELGNRLADRIRHIFYMKAMINPYEVVTKPTSQIQDLDRLEEILDEIDQADETGQPLFLHVHFMGTHGPDYNPGVRVFSKGKEDDKTWWEEDAYDDTILAFDSRVGLIIDDLKGRDMFDQTILVISSDHGQRYTTTERIPLVLHFPEGQFTGGITSNVQTIDIAPTILDYMGLKQPEWMMGQTMLGNIAADRPIFGVGVRATEQSENGKWQIRSTASTPPFYQFGFISVVYCQNWYLLILDELIWRTGEVDGYTAPCSEGIPSDAQILSMMAKRLSDDGFDVSSLTGAILQK